MKLIQYQKNHEKIFLYLLIFVVINTMFKSLRCVYSLKERKFIKNGGRDYSRDRHSPVGCDGSGAAAGWSWSGAIESDDPGVEPLYYATP